MEVSHIVVKRGGGYTLVGRGRLLERCIEWLRRGYILEGWVDYERVAYLRGGGIFSEGGIDPGRAG